jgi:tight adherence protein B
MSAGALLLALALMIAPTSSQRRLEKLRLVEPARRRMPAAAITACAATVLVFIVPITVVGAAAIVGSTLVVRRRRQRRLSQCRSESAALQAALDVLVGELRVGAHPVRAFEVASAEADTGIARSLRAVAARARLGADVAAGLRSVARRSPVPAHWERLAVCWQLAQAHGLAIATLMHTAQRDIVERERFSARVTAGMAGARATAAVLAVLPAVGVGFGQLIGADPVRFLLSGGAGGWLLVIGVALACAGLLWSDRITGNVLT